MLTLLPHWLVLGYLIVHSLLTAYSRGLRPGTAGIYLVNLALGGVFLVSLATSRDLPNPSPLETFYLLWAPILFFWWAYLWAGSTLHAVFPEGFTFDSRIVTLEERLGQPSLRWTRADLPWLTELLYFCYFSYYLYTPLLGGVLYAVGRFRDLEALSFAVCFGYAVSYTLFPLFPVWGPRWGLVALGRLSPQEQKPSGYLFTRLIHRIMYQGPAHKGGAMPSAHSSTAVVFLVWCWRLGGPEAGLPATLLVLGMWLGAVYGRFHYVTDLVAGGLLGLLGVWLARLLI